MKTTMRPVEAVLEALACESTLPFTTDEEMLVFKAGRQASRTSEFPAVLTAGFLQFLAEKLKESKKEPFRFQDQAYLGIDYGREESQTVVFRTGRASEKSTTLAARAIDMGGEPLYRDLYVDPSRGDE